MCVCVWHLFCYESVRVCCCLCGVRLVCLSRMFMCVYAVVYLSACDALWCSASLCICVCACACLRINLRVCLSVCVLVPLSVWLCDCLCI